MSEHVILLHGIWMRGLMLQPLARRLRRAGFGVEMIDYASVFAGNHAAAKNLRAHMRTIAAKTVHLVGHSLGALVALEALHDEKGLPPGHVVCLGPPLRGSAAARGLALIPGGRWLLGHSGAALIEGMTEWKGTRRVGVIAGSLPFGFGAGFAVLASPHDGTVAVEETRLPGIADHRIVRTTHTGMLLSDEVADLTIAFLREGYFDVSRADTAQAS